MADQLFLRKKQNQSD